MLQQEICWPANPLLLCQRTKTNILQETPYISPYNIKVSSWNLQESLPQLSQERGNNNHYSACCQQAACCPRARRVVTITDSHTPRSAYLGCSVPVSAHDPVMGQECHDCGTGRRRIPGSLRAFLVHQIFCSLAGRVMYNFTCKVHTHITV